MCSAPQGENLHVFSAFKLEADILVGGSLCTILRVEKVRIVCRPPDSPRNLTKKGEAKVMVGVGPGLAMLGIGVFYAVKMTL